MRRARWVGWSGCAVCLLGAVTGSLAALFGGVAVVTVATGMLVRDSFVVLHEKQQQLERLEQLAEQYDEDRERRDRT